MNRRELAKNGFLALCGALLGKKVKEPETEINYTVTCYTGGPTAWNEVRGDTGNG